MIAATSSHRFSSERPVVLDLCLRAATGRYGRLVHGWRELTLAILLLFGCSRAEPRVTPNPVKATTNMTSASDPSETTPSENGLSENGPSEKTLSSAGKETAIVAGGCFWGVEELLRVLPGVIATDVGYIGGAVADPTYNDVKTGRSGHAEAVRIIFDPSVLSYEKLLLHFFKIHDPTTKNRQGNDVGSQYRSAIFYQSPEQQQTALAVIKRVNESGAWKSPVTTEVVTGGEYTLAEDYHQDYLQKHPNGYTCHFERDVTYY